MSAEFSVITELRSMQISVAVSLLGITAFTLSRLAYSALANIESALRRATRAEAARKELLATMSHEIRTPLNGIISVSDLLGKGDHSETTQNHLNIIEMSASNLLTIVNESLGRARSEHLGEENTNAIQISNQPFDPSDLIQQVCNLFTANASQKGLWIGTYGLEALPDNLLGDAPHLRQVLNNLVGNAIKFTHRGGVRIGARLVDSTEENNAVQFFVQDTGVGIEDDAKARVFERFGQSASGLTTEADGTGLGLAISNDLVSAMGGTLEMESAVGVGTAFYFTLPIPIAVDSTKPVAA
jgi:signal transduction histidine kinase